MTGSSFEASPRTSPSSSPASRGGKIRSIVRPTNARTTWVIRTKGDEAPPIRWTSIARTLTASPRCASAAAKPGSSGICKVPWTSSRSPRTASGIVVVAARPTPSLGPQQRRPTTRPARRRPARASRTRSARGPRGASPGASRSAGARRRSSESSTRTAPRPAQPTPQSSDAERPASASAGPGPRRRSVARARRRPLRREQDRRRRGPTCEADRRGVAREPGPRRRRGRRTRAGATPTTARSTPGRAGGPTASTPAQNAAAAIGAPQPCIDRLTPSPGNGGPRGSRGRSRTPRRADRSTRTARARCGTG